MWFYWFNLLNRAYQALAYEFYFTQVYVHQFVFNKWLSLSLLE